MKTLRRILKFLTALVLGIGILIALFVYQAWTYRNPQGAIIYVEKGSSVKIIADRLEEISAIKSRFVFEAYVRITGRKLQSGEYAFDAGMTLAEIAQKLDSGDVLLRRLTIPEGYSLHDVRKVLLRKSLMSAQDFDKFVLRVDWLKGVDGAKDLEGFLFPETYSYDSQTTPERFFQAMVGMFFHKLGDERVKLAQDKGLNLLQLVTLASVVEKETGVARERPLIAGVFFNRLKINMPLQSDPTVIYGIENFNGNLTRADLQRDTPYNTYTRPGLPVGPICSPGLAAIDAVLSPASTDALYFVAKGDGSHHFSATLEEHNRAVRYFQLKQGDPP